MALSTFDLVGSLGHIRVPQRCAMRSDAPVVDSVGWGGGASPQHGSLLRLLRLLLRALAVRTAAGNGALPHLRAEKQRRRALGAVRIVGAHAE